MASVAYSRTNGQINVSSQHRKAIPVHLVCSETTSSIPSDVDHLVKAMRCQTSLGIGHTAAGGHVQCTIVIKISCYHIGFGCQYVCFIKL